MTFLWAEKVSRVGLMVLNSVLWEAFGLNLCLLRKKRSLLLWDLN
ncbi:MAG: hypothetical protein ABI417_18230 [Coleofasciculaceae cyanobacterium]